MGGRFAARELALRGQDRDESECDGGDAHSDDTCLSNKQIQHLTFAVTSHESSASLDASHPLLLLLRAIVASEYTHEFPQHQSAVDRDGAHLRAAAGASRMHAHRAVRTELQTYSSPLTAL